MPVEESEFQWEISASIPLFYFPLKEIKRHRDLLFRFVRRDFLASYQQTILGPFWVLLQPLLIMLTYVTIFKTVVGISTDNSPSGLFYLIGILVWNYFSESFTAISYSYHSYAGIFSKVYFPRILVAISFLISNMIRVGIQSVLFIGLFLWYLLHKHTIHPNLQILLVPFYLLLLSGMSMGLGLIFASLTVKYRDIQNLLYFLLRILLFVSPVIYPLSIVPAKYQTFFLLNPLTPLIEMTRYAFLGAGYHNFYYLGYCILFTILVFSFGLILFNRRDAQAMDII